MIINWLTYRNLKFPVVSQFLCVEIFKKYFQIEKELAAFVEK